ncbi:hypothetical protein LUZ61_009304 [Rhynchospora tenuis]|uniref:Uncharacterized protein n=1 Tax=Rhynchospora tenuis TaxID=198213 RepID=A0AAD5ZXA0_9POAL|nr:hypothetical protein LUZ61_009304 [Rhynchospora tenuis]
MNGGDQRIPAPTLLSSLQSAFSSRDRSTKRERDDMSALGTGKGLLEIGKFAVYVAVPVALTYAVATENKTFQKIMGLKPYVVYPPEGPKPPSPEELRERAREIARKNKTN